MRSIQILDTFPSVSVADRLDFVDAIEDHLRTKGWRQDGYLSERGGGCLVVTGDILAGIAYEMDPHDEVPSLPPAWETWNDVLEVMDSLANEDGFPFTAEWNDHEGRSFEEVIAFLDRTREAIRATSIGEPRREYIVEPVTTPVPERFSPPAPAPSELPSAPSPAREKEPVPA